MKHLLLVEDDQNLGYILKEYLQMYDFQIQWVKDGEEGLSAYFNGKFDLCIIATGLLQDKEITPEKNMKSLKTSSFNKSFLINTIGPALVAKHFIPLLRNDKKAVLAAISARVGSISDNKIGGWYAYRASKAALNMVIKCLSIEVSRKSKNQIILGLHPGTVDTNLSKPFQKNVPKEKLFSSDFSALKLLNVINKATVNESGSLLAWDGSVISF